MAEEAPVMMARAEGPDLSAVNINDAPDMKSSVTPQEAPTPAPVPVESLEPTLLSSDTNPKPSETVEAPKEAPVAVKNEGGQTEQAPPPESISEAKEVPLPEAPKEVVFEPWTLPEGVSLDQAKVSEFTGLLKSLELEGKADHAELQAFGQKAMDLYLNEAKKAVEDLTKSYTTAWNKQINDWKDDFLKDPVLGGNRFQSTLDSANNFIRTHGGSPDEQAEFRSLMETSGLGNNKVMIRILSNAGRMMDEGKPLAASTPVSAPNKSKVETLYGKNR